MLQLYRCAMENGQRIYHRDYCLYNDNSAIAYDSGKIRCISLQIPVDSDIAEVTVYYADGDVCRWSTKWITSYNFQFGIPVSPDGKYVFVQTWENGLICLDARSGARIWKTGSRRGVTSVFVNGNTILCHRHGQALQLLDIHTGELLAEKRPAAAWGFTAIDHGCIVCQVSARRWEIIDAETLEVKEGFSHREFTGGHTDYCVNRIEKTDDGTIRVCGFQNIWDDTVTPAVMLPNLEFEHLVRIDIHE